ncbi:MAG: TetR/AcrR family transcriptional regulator [Syntrophales bacterium]|nr:TetR/AcrR family transcriptional regulator [Syntrophales bacterium]
MLTFAEFQELVNLSMEALCRDFFRENPDRVRVKKEATVVRNLVKILDATLMISNQKGFQAMSVRDLSRETGLSMGALYSYISGKEELLAIIRSQGYLIVVRILTGAIAEVSNPHEKLRQAIQTHLYLSEAMRAWFYFSYMETKNLSKEEQKKSIQMELFTEKLFIDILSAGCRAGHFRPLNVELTAAAIKALLQDWYLKPWKHQRRKVTIEEYVRFVTGLVEAYVLPSADIPSP